MAQGGPNKKVGNDLVALSSAAVLAVYSAGYLRTRPAAERLAAQAIERRVPAAVVPRPSIPNTPAPESPAVEASVVSTSPRPSRKPAPDHPPGMASTERLPAQVEPPSAPEAPPPIEAVITPAPVAEVVPVTVPAKAPEVVPAPAPAPEAPAHPMWKDGTYHGWGYSRHGNIEAAVVIESGRITSATISQCLTRYDCSVIEKLPPQVVERQSPDVDTVSSATQSADAFYYAVVEALAKAK